MDSSSASVGVVFVLLRVITSLFLFLVSSTYADNSSALQSPLYCFDQGRGSVCLLSVEYPLEAAYYSDIGDDSCGYPGFEVYCNDQYGQRPFLNISNHIYHVLYINYKSTTKAIVLVDIDVEGSGCPQPKRNFSFPSSPSWVNYILSEGNITIFYNCSGSVPVDAEKHILCSKQDTNTPPSYAFYHYETRNREGFDWYGNCAQNVVVPVMHSNLIYSDAIKKGFYMVWSATDWCEGCELSGGQCWSNSTAATGCACRNGKSYNTTCPRQLTSPPPPRHKGTNDATAGCPRECYWNIWTRNGIPRQKRMCI